MNKYYLDLLDTELYKDGYYKEEDCCSNKEIINNVCHNCGVVDNDNPLEDRIEEIDCHDIEIIEVSYTKLIGRSSFGSIKRFHNWTKIDYDTRTLTLEILPIIENIYKKYYPNVKKNIINKTYFLYKDYFKNRDNIRRRNKMKTILIIFFIYIVCNQEKIHFPFKKIIEDNNIKKHDLKYFKQTNTIKEDQFDYSVKQFISIFKGKKIKC